MSTVIWIWCTTVLSSKRHYQIIWLKITFTLSTKFNFIVYHSFSIDSFNEYNLVKYIHNGNWLGFSKTDPRESAEGLIKMICKRIFFLVSSLLAAICMQASETKTSNFGISDWGGLRDSFPLFLRVGYAPVNDLFSYQPERNRCHSTLYRDVDFKCHGNN